MRRGVRTRRGAGMARSRVAQLAALVLGALVLLASCGTPLSPAKGPVGNAVAVSIASRPTAPPFDPSAGAPLPDNRIVTAYGISGGGDANGPASTCCAAGDLLPSFLPQLQRLGQQYAAADPTHPVKLGIDLVVDIFAGCGGLQYCAGWTSDDTIQRYVTFCQQNNLLLFFDMQFGTEPVEHAVTTHLLKYLEQYPFTELALDTEFHAPNTSEGYAEESQYPNFTGHMDASEVNWAIAELAQISLQQHLPRKVLIVHQFLPFVLPDKNQIKRNPNVSLVLQADGFGGHFDKLSRYQEFVQQDLLEYGGYKLFYYYSDSGIAYDVDENGVKQPQSPQTVLQELFPQPLFISYQ